MTFINQLRDLLQQPLPHHDIRKEGLDPIMLEFILRSREAAEENMKKRPPRPCAVLTMLYQKKDIWHTTLIVRPAKSRVHPGQLAFPGGKKEEQDPNLQTTAIREAMEEVGVQVSNEQVLGPLSTVYIPPSNTIVTPYVAYLESPPTFTPQPNEVDLILEPSLNALIDPINVRQKKVVMATGEVFPLPAFQVGAHLVWGGTARMISELNKLVVQI
ncbi:MAG: CoA pyrophosphatase [Saprospiraceae bacterium]